ncbi:T9SS type A sorting domain-containing protein [Chitinophagaceae bacterium MMS25-I14]
MKSTFKFLSVMLIAIFCGQQVRAQLSGTITVPSATYPTLDSVIRALNNQGVGTGGATISLTSSNPQVAPSGGYKLGSTVLNASLSATKPLTINGNGNTVTAYVGTGTADGIFTLLGADYVTINALHLLDTNTASANAEMEWGYGFVKLNSAAPFDGCQNNTISGCNITLNRNNANSPTAASWGGSKGVMFANWVLSAPTTQLTITAVSDAHNNNTIKGCNIQNVNMGVYMYGFNDGSATPALYDQNNVIGGYGAADGNTITNFGGAAYEAAGIYLYGYVSGAVVRGNTINNIANGGVAGANTLDGIYQGSSTGANTTIRSNNVTLTQGSVSSSVQGIITYCGANATANTINVDSNSLTITGNGSSHTTYAYYLPSTAGAVNLNLNANNLTVNTASTGTLYCFYLALPSYGTAPVWNINDNKCRSLTRTGSSGTTYGFYQTGSILGGTVYNQMRNNVSNVTYPTTNSGSFYANYVYGGTGTYGVRNVAFDTVSNVTIGTGTFYGFYTYNYAAGSTFNNNYFNSVTSSGTQYYIYFSSSSITGTSVYKNTVSNGINNSTSAFTYGLYLSGATSIDIYNNNINNLKSYQTTGSAIYGMYISTATALNVYNNMISEIQAPTGNSVCPVYGMYFSGGTTENVYHNTINLGASAPLTGGTNFGATGIYYGSGITTFDMRNNIVRVNATAAGTGFVAAVRRSAGTAGTVPSNLATTSNSNIYYAPNATNSYLYAEGSALPLVNAYNLTSDPGFNTTCGLYKTFMVPRESAAFNENNLSQIGTTATYAPTGTSYAKSDAVPTTSPAVTTDYNGVTRTSPADAGALQFTGTANDAAAPIITYTALPKTTYCTNGPTLPAVITDATGVNTTAGTAPRIYYRKSTDLDTFGVANNSTGNGWKYVEATGTAPNFTFTIDYTKLQSAIAVNDSIVYFVVAQDVATTPNVGANVVGFHSGYCPVSVNILAAGGATTAAPVANGYRVLTLPAFSAVATQYSLCLSGSTSLSLSPVPSGTSVQWQQDNGTGTFSNISGATASTYTTPVITATNKYRALIQCGGSTIATSTVDTIVVNNPQLLSTTPATRCGIGSVTLQATAGGSATLNWYAAATGGTALYTGSSFATPTIGSTTTYYVTAASGGGSGNVGKTGTTGADGSNTSGAYLIFDAYSAFTLQSVVIYPSGSGSGTVTIQLQNSAGTTLQSYVATVTGASSAVPVTVPVNFAITPGTAYRLVYGSSTGGVTALYRDYSSGITFPYTLAGVCSITNGSLSGYYYYFYNWTVSTGCETSRTPVVATVTAPPAIAASSPNSPGICTGANGTITVTSANTGYKYFWSPIGTTGATQTVSPTANTNYVVTAVDTTTGTTGGCVAKDSVALKVSPVPPTPVVSPATSTICSGSPAQLTGTIAGTAMVDTLGTGTTVNGITTYPTPFGQYYGSNHEQYLILASELTAQGLAAGNFNTLSLNLSTGYTYASLQNFSVNMANTSATSMAAMITSGFTNVYSNSSYTPPSSSGWTTITFSTPFAWDGVSNVVVDVSNSNCSVCNGTSSCTTSYTDNGIVYQSTTPFVSTINFHADNNCTINSFAPSISGTTYSQRPNMILTGSKTYNINWLNVTSLYKNSGLTQSVSTSDTNKIVYASPASNSTYTARANNQGCFSPASAAVTVNVLPLPTATVTPAGTASFCGGSSALLTGSASTGVTYQWLLNGTAISGATNSTYNATAIGSYTFRVTNTATSCVNTSAAVTVVNAPPPVATATAAGPTTVCGGSSVTLNANTGTGLTYQWMLGSTPISGQTNATYTATASGNYSVMVYNAGNCSTTSAAVPVTVNTINKTIASSGSTTFCVGGSDTLSVPNNANQTYQWRQGGTAIGGATNNYYVATGTGSYSVKIVNTGYGCTDSSVNTAITVGTGPLAAFSPSGIVGICPGSSVTFSIAPVSGVSYQWRLNGTNIGAASTNSYTATAAGAYTLVTSTSPTCQSTSPVTTVVVNPAPNVVTTPSGAATVCQNGTLTMSVPTGTSYTYQWKSGGINISGATSNTYTTGTPGNYAVRVINGLTGCADTSVNIAVTQVATPPATATAAGPLTICSGDTTKLKANSGSGLSYQWQIGGLTISGATDSIYRAMQAGSYTVKVTNTGNCSATSAALTVNVNPLPVSTITYNSPLVFCQGGGVVLNAVAANGVNYQWLQNGSPITGAVTSSYIVYQSGGYQIKVTSTLGCSALSQTIPVTVNPLPNPVITKNGFTLSTGAFTSYQWFLNNTALTNGHSQSITATQNGAYHVVVTDANGCTNSSTVIFVNNVGISNITAAGDIRIFPNPTNGIVNIDAPVKVNISVRDLSGKVVLFAPDAQKVDITSVANGVYMMMITDTEGHLLKVEKVFKTQ